MSKLMAWLKALFKKKYRVVSDRHYGYEVQFRVWWFPIWLQDDTNTHRTIEDAKECLEECKRRDNYKRKEYYRE
jgi:hypothetical protein